MPETPPRTIRLYATGAIAAVMLAGLALKAERYGDQSAAPDFSAFEAASVTALAVSGWHPAPPVTDAADTAFRTLTFAHERCGTAVTVAILGHTPGLAAQARQRLGDADLIQDGRAVEAFDARSLQTARLASAVNRRLGLATEPPPPLLAIAPPLAALAAACPDAAFPDPARAFRDTETVADEPEPGKTRNG